MLGKSPTGHEITARVPTSSLDYCDKYITPQCLRSLYSIDYKPVVPQLNSLGIGVSSFTNSLAFFLTHPVEFTPQTYVGSDLDLFFS